MKVSNGGVVRSLEATYWRVLRKKVRANNVMNGTRETFVDKLKRNYLGVDVPSVISSRGITAEATPKERETPSVPQKVVSPAGNAGGKVKPRLPIPFFGLEQQVFRDQEVIFTCVVGDRHFLQEPVLTTGYEHVLYADRDLPFSGWAHRPLLFWDAAPKMISLFHKYAIASVLPENTKMLWIDSRVEVSRDVAQSVFSCLDENDLCLFRHYERDCVYDEVLAVLEAKRSSSVQCEEYARYLRDRSFPRGAGLFETGVLGFKVTPDVKRLFRRVFGLCYRYANRDQLALPVALAEYPVRAHLYNGGASHLRDSPGIVVRSWKEKEVLK